METEDFRDPAQATPLIVIPGGGGQRNPDDCTTLPTWSRSRLDLAASLWKQLPRNKDAKLVTLSLGTPHRPSTLNADGFVIPESVSAASYLHAVHGIPYTALLRETSSLDTIGNAFFLRVTLTDPLRWRHLIVVTSDFHMPRLRRIFDWLFEIHGNPSSSLSTLPYRIDYVEASDALMPPDVRDHRQRKEREGTERFDAVKRLIDSAEGPFLARVTRFMFLDHKAYSVHATMVPRAPLNRSLIASY